MLYQKAFSVESREGVGLISFLISLFFLSMMINLKYLKNLTKLSSNSGKTFMAL